MIIGGELAEAGEVLLEPIRAAIEQASRSPRPPRRCASSRASSAQRAEVLGAATIQLARAPEALANRLLAA